MTSILAERESYKMKSEEDANSKAFLDDVETENNINEYQAKKDIDGTQNITMIL